MWSEKDLLDFMSLKDCKGLKELILQNSDLPLLAFVDCECLGDEFRNYSLSECYCSVKELTLYESCSDECRWMDRDDYEEQLQIDMADDEQYSCLSKSEFFAILQEKINNTSFVKAIVVELGE